MRITCIRTLAIQNSKYPTHELVEVTIEDKPDQHFAIGDVVKVWDGSYNFEKKTNIHRHGVDPLFEKSAVIISVTEPDILKWKGPGIFLVPLEILIVFTSGEKIHVAKNCLIKA